MLSSVPFCHLPDLEAKGEKERAGEEEGERGKERGGTRGEGEWGRREREKN